MMKELGLLLIIMVLFMAANILLGAVKADLKGMFDRESLLKGLKKAAVVAVAFAMMAIAGVLAPAMEMTFGGVSMTIVDVLKTIVVAAIALYFGKAALNLKDILGIDAAPAEIVGEKVYESIPEATESDESVG